jgi:hypothetical protein
MSTLVLSDIPLVTFGCVRAGSCIVLFYDLACVHALLSLLAVAAGDGRSMLWW